jgi:[ribosomal protein S5]-alanine N-acetyltransferase
MKALRRAHQGSPVIVELTLPTGVVRAWQPADAPSLAHHANDRRIWLNLRDRFPHPYRLSDAEAFITMATAMSPTTFFAIAVDGEAVGGIGYTLHDDVERAAAEVGYWLGTSFWGRGLTTSALVALTRYAFDRHVELRRIYAVPYAWSAASVRVLEKAGYRLEGRMRQSAIKDGKVTDQLLYAILREELAPPATARE